VFGFELERVNFLRIDKDVMTLGVLVPLMISSSGTLFEALLGLNAL